MGDELNFIPKDNLVNAKIRTLTKQEYKNTEYPKKNKFCKMEDIQNKITYDDIIILNSGDKYYVISYF